MIKAHFSDQPLKALPTGHCAAGAALFGVNYPVRVTTITLAGFT